MKRGRLITLEGGEGTGKSTQVRRLASWISGKYEVEVEVTREPGGAPGAEAIRELLIAGATDRWDPGTEALLHVAARREHVLRTIRPALAAGRWVISDRFFDSTRAYQGLAQGAGLEFVDGIGRLAIGTLRPDLTFILDLPIGMGLARAESRGTTNRYERMGEAFHERLRRAFLTIASEEADRIRVVDASGSEDDVAGLLESEVLLRWPIP